jgi:hypothetical protein
MNSMKLYLLLLSGIFLFFSCDSKREIGTDIQDGDIYEVQVDLKKNILIECDSLLKEVVFITLEYGEESFISSIKRVKFFEKKFFLLDENANKLLVFSEKGDFLYKIGKKGVGPGEFQDLADFDLDTLNRHVLVLEKERREVIRFTMEGDYLSENRLGFQADQFSMLGNNHLAFFIGYFDDDYHNLKITDLKGKLKRKLFPYPKDKRTFPFGFTGNLVSTKKGVLYSDASSSNIYQVFEDGKILKKYEIKFSTPFWSEENKYEHDAFFDKVQKGHLNFLRNDFLEIDDFLLICYNEHLGNEYGGTNRPRVGFFDNGNKFYCNYSNFTPNLIPYCLSGPKGYYENRVFSFIDPIKVEYFSSLIDSSSNEIFNSLLMNREEANPILVTYSLDNKLVSNVQ